MLCKQGFEIKPHRSGAGWYIGTHDEEGYPFCRISVEYYETEKLAKAAMKSDSWTRRDSFENRICCGE